VTDVPARPPTRWARGGAATSQGYGRHFARLVDDGADLEGEARLADALVPRAARILDVGAGMGRVTAALGARGHTVVGVEPDADLVAQARTTYPGIDVLHADALDLAPALVGDPFDLAVLVGNVMVFLAEGTERHVLSAVRRVLAPAGRVLVGFHPSGAPAGSREYPPEEFVADAAASGLVVHLRASTYELHPPSDDYTVWVLGLADGS
jgi:SAM-dependent methyltransferase